MSLVQRKTVEVLDRLFADNLLIQQILEGIIKAENINDPDVSAFMNTLDSRVEDTNKRILELKEVCRKYY